MEAGHDDDEHDQKDSHKPVTARAQSVFNSFRTFASPPPFLYFLLQVVPAIYN